jgi:hypothetical protein
MLKNKTCSTCGCEFAPNSGRQIYCSISCNPYKSNREADPETGRRKSGPISTATKERTCPVCSSTFLSRWDRQVCCSRSCARKLDNKRSGPRGWKGGRSKHSAGYIKVLAKDHPRADSSGYVMEHIAVMERQLGRHLEPHERVHHKNSKRDDNRPENLELWLMKPGSMKDPAGQRVHDLIEHGIASAERFGIHPPALRALLEHLLLRAAVQPTPTP